MTRVRDGLVGLLTVQLACKSELSDELAALKAKLESKVEDGDMRAMMDRHKHGLQVNAS
jgi:hypothetical protein